MPYIRISELTKKIDEQIILDAINLSINQYEFVSLLGPSGSGKSTLLNMIAGLDRPTYGRIFIDDFDITDLQASNRGVAMIFQDYSLFPSMTVYQNVAFSLRIQKKTEEEIGRAVHKALDLVEMLPYQDQYPSQLSGGQQQRTAIARSIVTNAKILLLDEPFSAIDAQLRKSLRRIIKTVHEEVGLTSIFVTHDQEEALSLSDKIFVMSQGHIEQVGTPEEIYLSPKNKFVASFIGDYNILQFDGQTIGFRAEDIELHPFQDLQKKDLQLSGTIEIREFQGYTDYYLIRTEESLIQVQQPFDASKNFMVGDRVTLTVPNDKTIIL